VPPFFHQFVLRFLGLLSSFGITVIACVDGAKGSDGDAFGKLDEFRRRCAQQRPTVGSAFFQQCLNQRDPKRQVFFYADFRKILIFRRGLGNLSVFNI